MEVVFFIGRIIVGVYYLFNAANHLIMGTEQLTQYAQYKGVPAPRLAVIVTGILLLIGGLSFLLGVYPGIGVLSVVLFFLPVSFKMHNFWALQDQQQRMIEMVNFTKNMALMGSALMFLLIERWPFSLTPQLWP
ncbi:DoxX family protein [Thermoflexus sp.]|uniref:DoxX family protein n=1 Tax=Thermoflexus sp. TaxID=1969742 RepID=UPI0035E45F6E